ncbi:MAG: alpha/beta fold hydrolase [Planctomycetaceae bacterium]
MHIATPDGQALHVVDRGAGTPILLVHGFPLDHTMWRGQIDDLSQTFRVIAPDLRGFGESGVAETDTLTMDRHANDLHALLDALNITEPVVLCGLSMGGYVAFRFLETCAERLQALVLCDTRPAADAPEGAETRKRMAAEVLRDGPQPALDAMLPKLVSKKTMAERPGVLERLREIIVGTDRRSIAAALHGMAQRPDSTPLLSGISVPTLVVCGEEDALTPAYVMRAMAGKIPGAQYVEIPAAGHMAPMEDPATVNAAIRAFLER